MHIYVLGLKLMRWNFLSYLYEVMRTNVSADFSTFRNFDRNFSKFVAPSSDENENHVLPLKGRYLLKKAKPHENRQ